MIVRSRKLKWFGQVDRCAGTLHCTWAKNIPAASVEVDKDRVALEKFMIP